LALDNAFHPDGRTPIVDDRVTAVTSGVLATAAMLAFMWPVDAFTAYHLQAHRAIAGLLNAPSSVGVAVFVVGGVLVWPLVFFAIGQHLAPGEIMRGVVLSLLLWIAFSVVFVPAVALSEFLIFIVLTLLAHLIYGSVLGFSFARLGGEHR
jgi:hypothetical protein